MQKSQLGTKSSEYTFFSLLVYHFMALALLVNIPFLFYFSQKNCEIGSLVVRQTRNRETHGRTVRVGRHACKCWQAWVALCLTENFEHNVLWGGKSSSFHLLVTRIFRPLLRNTDPVGTLEEQRILFLLCHSVSAVSSVSENHAERITWACAPNGLWHEVPSWANRADKVVYDYTVINGGTNESKGK